MEKFMRNLHIGICATGIVIGCVNLAKAESFTVTTERAYAYRGTNYKFQGSAADVIKIAMDAAHTSGVFDYIGYPLLQVHDELDFSERDDSPAMQEAYRYLQHLLETSVKLKIPVKVDSSYGEDWSKAK